MADFLALVNKVVLEGGSEMNLLSSSSWNSAEAGRKLYPRIKRNVADAWKKLQMQRFEWAFKNAQINTLLLPRLKFQAGSLATAPIPGDEFEGQESGFRFVLKGTKYLEGDWNSGTAKGQMEWDTFTTDAQLPVLGEMFKRVSPTTDLDAFEYLGRGSYKLQDFGPAVREPLWDTFVVRPTGGGAPTPAVPIPWQSWRWATISWAGTSYLAPAYVAKDFEGALNFYPQAAVPFHVSFVTTQSPQILEDEDDVPILLQEEYHDWIAWEALMNIARFDKNPDLLAYAANWAAFYRQRADRELMPPTTWGANRYTLGDEINE